MYSSLVENLQSRYPSYNSTLSLQELIQNDRLRLRLQLRFSQYIQWKRQILFPRQIQRISSVDVIEIAVHHLQKRGTIVAGPLAPIVEHTHLLPIEATVETRPVLAHRQNLPEVTPTATQTRHTIAINQDRQCGRGHPHLPPRGAGLPLLTDHPASKSTKTLTLTMKMKDEDLSALDPLRPGITSPVDISKIAQLRMRIKLGVTLVHHLQ
jgi:hypothetical protein